MHYEITSIDSVYRSYDESVDVQEFFKDKDCIGKTFDTDDAMQEYIFALEQEYAIDIESFSYMEHKTEEEEEEEWNSLIASAWDEAEDTGRSFDHIMGEHLAGIHWWGRLLI